MWNLESDFPAVLGWILPSQSLCAHQTEGMIAAQVDRAIKRTAFHELFMKNESINTIPLSGTVPKGELRRDEYSCEFCHHFGEQMPETEGLWAEGELYA